MDKNNIKNLREDLIAEFQAFTQTHTTVIGNLLEEFNDDRLLVTIETKGYEHEHLQAEKEAEVATQVSADVLTERATQETKKEEVKHVDPEIEQVVEQATEPKQEEVASEGTLVIADQ